MRDLAGIETRTSLHLEHLEQTIETELLVVVQRTFDTGATDISLIGDTTNSLDHLRETLVLLGEGIDTGEHDLAHH